MSEAGRRRWWRGVAATLIGGGAAAGLWFGVIRNAGAEPVPPQHARLTEMVNPGATAAPPAPNVPAAPKVTIEPSPPAEARTDVHVVPAAVSVPTLAVPPTLPAPPVVPASAVAPVQPPAVPPLPLTELPPVPAAPARPATPPDLTPTLPAMVGGIPRLEFGKPPVTPVTNVPAGAAIPPPPASGTPAAPVVPAIPPIVPVVPPPAPVTPPAAVKLPEPPSSAIPVPPVSRLPGGNGGTTVKPDSLGGGTGPILPVVPVIPPAADPVKPVVPAVPAIGTPGIPTGTPVDLVRPPAPIDPIVPTPGETMLHLNRAAALAVLGGAIMAPSSPVSAAPALPVPFPPASPIGADDKAELEALKTQVATANQKLTDIQRDLKQLTEAINGRKDEKGVPLSSDPGLVAQMKSLTDKLYEVEKELNKLKTQTTLRPANPIVTPDPKAGKGTVRVVNEYPVRISIVVNGTSYRVEPTKSVDIDVAAGEFTYQLLESGAASTKSVIKEKETVTLRIK